MGMYENNMCMYKNTFANFKQVDELINKGEISKAKDILHTIDKSLKKFEGNAYYHDWVESILDGIQIRQELFVL